MAYTKQTWADLPSKTTPINASRLTHIEDGIFNAAATADNAASTAGTAAANVGIVSGKVETLTERVNGLDTAVSNKVDKVAGKGLSTNDYSNAEKAKVGSIAPTEDDSTSASTDYEVGEEFFLSDGLLYEATSLISQGSAIIVYPTSGYNCKLSDSVTGQIQAIKDGLGTASTKNSTSVVTDSSDLVESGAVKDIVGWGNKNLLPITLKNIQSGNTSGTWVRNTYVKNGITFTINTDNNGNVADIVANGTAEGQVNTELNLCQNNTYYLPAGSYILSGGVSYNARIFYYDGTSYYNSRPDEVIFDVLGNENETRYTIVVVPGTTVNNAVFKPMIRKATVSDSTYEPYHASVEEYCASKQLLEDTVGWISDNQARLYDWTGSASNVTFTYTKEQVTLNGTCTGDIAVPSSVAVPEDGKHTLKAGSYEIISDADNMSWQVVALNPVVVIASDSKPFTITEDKTVYIRAVAKNGVTYNNQVVHVELRRQSVDTVKADNSVIAPVENGSTASQAYAVGEHFIRDGAFCTCTQAISQGGSFTLGTNYTAGDVADELTVKSVPLTPSGSLTLQPDESMLIVKNGIANLSFQLNVPSGVTLAKGAFSILFTFDREYAPKNGVYGVGLTNVETNPIFSRLAVTSSGACTCRISDDIVGVSAIQGSLSWPVGN